MDEALKRGKARLRAKAWREANPERYKAAVEKCKAAKPEKYKALHKSWVERNPERIIAYRNKVPLEKRNAYIKEWNEKNISRRREIANEWRKRNPEKVNAVYAHRRAAKMRATPKWANNFFIAEAYHLARLRTKATGIKWHVDHIVPLTSPLVCGLHVEHNIRVVPASVNQSKNNRHWPDMP